MHIYIDPYQSHNKSGYGGKKEDIHAKAVRKKMTMVDSAERKISLDPYHSHKKEIDTVGTVERKIDPYFGRKKEINNSGCGECAVLGVKSGKYN